MDILLTEPLIEGVDDFAIERLKKLGSIRIAKSKDEKDLLFEIKDAELVIVRTAKITRKIIENAEHLKAIARTGTGVENIDITAANDHNIMVINAPSYNAISVAEHVFSLIFALTKNLIVFDRETRKGNFAIRDKLLKSNFEINGKTLGIIGLGSIGREVLRISQAFQMKIRAYDPYLPLKFKNQYADILVDSLDFLLSDSDIVTIHVPLTNETKNLIGRRELSLMKKTAFLINCARGGIVNEEALISALSEGLIAGAGIDVFEKEPPEASKLFELPNVVLTPHVAGHTREARIRIMSALVEDLERVAKGERPLNLVNPEIYKK